MYRGSEELSQRLRLYISPYILRYISHKMNWKRILTDRTLPIVKGILAGTMPAAYYRHISIKEESKNE